MGVFDPGCLKGYCIILGTFLLFISLGGIGFSLFLLFGEPLAKQTYHTYRPNWEEIGPLLSASIISLLTNIALIGGAKLLSKKIVLTWLIWKYCLIILFWAWYGYHMLKHHGYIDWTEYGMRQCYWCPQKDIQEMMGYIGAMACFGLLVFMAPVHVLHAKLKKQERLLNDYQYEQELEPQEYSQNQFQQQYQYQQQYPYQQQHYVPQQQYHPQQYQSQPYQQQYHQYSQQLQQPSQYQYKY